MNTELLKGVILGFLSPIIFFIIVVVFFLDYELSLFVNKYLTEYNLPSIISLSLLANLALFFIKIKMNKDKQSRGILFSSIVFGVLIVFLKFL